MIITRSKLRFLKNKLKRAIKHLTQLNKICDNGTDDYVYSADIREKQYNIIRICKRIALLYIV